MEEREWSQEDRLAKTPAQKVALWFAIGGAFWAVVGFGVFFWRSCS